MLTADIRDYLGGAQPVIDPALKEDEIQALINAYRQSLANSDEGIRQAVKAMLAAESLLRPWNGVDISITGDNPYVSDEADEDPDKMPDQVLIELSDAVRGGALEPVMGSDNWGSVLTILVRCGGTEPNNEGTDATYAEDGRKRRKAIVGAITDALNDQAKWPSGIVRMEVDSSTDGYADEEGAHQPYETILTLAIDTDDDPRA